MIKVKEEYKSVVSDGPATNVSFSSPSQKPKPLVSSIGVSHEANKIANSKIYFLILNNFLL